MLQLSLGIEFWNPYHYDVKCPNSISNIILIYKELKLDEFEVAFCFPFLVALKLKK